MDKMDKNIICRICLRCDIESPKKCLSLFEKYNDSLISEKINSITNLTIEEGDDLPDRICPDCLLELENAVKFIQKCESSNAILLNTKLHSIEFDVPIKKEDIDPINEEDHKYEDSNSSSSDDDELQVKQEQLITSTLKKSRAIDLKLECHDCGSLFKSKCKLGVHWKKVHRPKLLCPNCKRTFKSYVPYHIHMKKKGNSCITASKARVEGEGKSRIFYCKDCDYKSKRIKDIGTHLVIHSGDRPFQCDMCPKTFTQQSSMQAHKESAHADFKVEAACHFCGKFIKGRNKLYRHLKTHRSEQVQCDICKKILRNKKTLAIHMQRHSGVRSYTCEICASMFYTYSELCNHRRFTHASNRQHYRCEKCDYTAKRSETIKRHMSKHTSTNLACTLCGMFSENAQELALHQKRHFDKRYSCPHCEKKFFGRKSANKHIRAKHKCTMVSNNSAKAVNIKMETLTAELYDPSPTVID